MSCTCTFHMELDVLKNQIAELQNRFNVVVNESSATMIRLIEDHERSLTTCRREYKEAVDHLTRDRDMYRDRVTELEDQVKRLEVACEDYNEEVQALKAKGH